MRHILTGVGLGALLAVTGCNSWSGSRTPAAAQAQLPTTTPSAAALVKYLNDNASRVDTIDCRELDLDCKQGMQGIGLQGKMVCQKPRNFRMSASVVGKDAVDMGSNNQEFWYWISKADPPYQFHCAYDDLANGKARMPFPFQPDWIVQAMGVAEYGPPENYQVVVQQNTLELVERTTGPRGEPLRKVTVFNRAPAQGTAPQVTAHLLQDGNGKTIAGAYISAVQRDPATNAVIPKKIRLEYPAEKISLTLVLSEVALNPQMSEKRVAALFNRPHYENIRSFDLGRHGLDGPGGVIQPAGVR